MICKSHTRCVHDCPLYSICYRSEEIQLSEQLIEMHIRKLLDKTCNIKYGKSLIEDNYISNGLGVIATSYAKLFRNNTNRGLEI